MRSVRITRIIDLGVLIHHILREWFVRTLVVPFETDSVLRGNPFRIQRKVFGRHDSKRIEIHQCGLRIPASPSVVFFPRRFFWHIIIFVGVDIRTNHHILFCLQHRASVIIDDVLLLTVIIETIGVTAIGIRLFMFPFTTNPCVSIGGTNIIVSIVCVTIMMCTTRCSPPTSRIRCLFKYIRVSIFCNSSFRILTSLIERKETTSHYRSISLNTMFYSL